MTQITNVDASKLPRQCKCTQSSAVLAQHLNTPEHLAAQYHYAAAIKVFYNYVSTDGREMN